jgi:hypothetical protein
MCGRRLLALNKAKEHRVPGSLSMILPATTPTNSHSLGGIGSFRFNISASSSPSPFRARSIRHSNSSLARSAAMSTFENRSYPELAGPRVVNDQIFKTRGVATRSLLSRKRLDNRALQYWTETRCGCAGANRRTCLIWPAKELSVSAVPARAWAFLRQRRSRRELSLLNTKAASLRPSRLINLRPEATAISTRSTAVGRSTELAERTSDVT